jgi:hypothetical protein
MDLLFFPPSEAVSILVDSYQVLRIADLPEFITDKHVPNGYASFVFNFAGDVYVVDNERIAVPQFFLTYPILKSFNIEASGKLDSFVVICNATVLAKAFNISLKTSAKDFFIKLDPLVFLPLWEKLKSAKEPQARIEIFEMYLLKGDLAIKYQPDEIDSIYFNILKFSGKIRITETTQSYLLSDRTFRRNFLKRAGINA